MAKQGFSERLYLKYLRTKFKTLSILSPNKAASIAFDLFCTPYPKYKKTKAPAIFNQGERISLSLDDQTILKGFMWKPALANGKTVLIAHGYASYFYKFEQYIQPLLKEGFTVIGFDAPGHGRSQGKYINVIIYNSDIIYDTQQQIPLNLRVSSTRTSSRRTTTSTKRKRTNNRETRNTQ
jgi:pimeloyl-ACP methyl ester carboxylesterase